MNVWSLSPETGSYSINFFLKKGLEIMNYE